MSQKVRAAVIGVGYLGRFHAQKYKLIENAELVGVVDPSPERGQEVASELGVQYFESHKDIVGKVDAVTIASTTRTHYELAKFCLENGIHVHVEKPMTALSSEGQELCEIAKKNNLKLQVGHVERFNPALTSAKESLKKPLFIECHRLAPFKPRGVDVSVVLDLMIHDLDVVLSLVKSEVVKVSAVGTPVITKAYDICNARVEFASGAVANMTASRVSLYSQRKFRVFQDSQYLSMDFGSGEVSMLTKTGEWDPATADLDSDDLPLDHKTWNLKKSDALLLETESFVDVILNDKECIVSGEDGLVALRLAEQITQAMDERLAKGV